MDTNDCPSEREYLSVAEGLNLINDKNIGSTYVVDDLIYKAAIGQLIIYVLTNDWSASQIYEIDHSKPNTDLKIRFTGPKEPPFPNSKDMEELERQTLAYKNWVGTQDAVYGNRTIYGQRGQNVGFYALRMSSHKPIAAITFKKFYEGDFSSKIELNLGKILNSTDSTKEYYFCPDLEVLLQDALDDGKLYVKRHELQNVFPSEIPAIVVAMPKSVPVAKCEQEAQDGEKIMPVSPSHTGEMNTPKQKISGAGKKTVRGPSEKTEGLRADWRRRAAVKRAKNPALSDIQIARAIEADLRKERVSNPRAANTIVKWIKV